MINLSNQTRYISKRCRYFFNDFTCTHLGRLRISFNIISHLLYLFVLGVPAYSHHKEGKRGWGSIEHKNLVFGIYKKNGIVITFPVYNRKHETLIPLIKQYTKKGSLYYTDDHTAYAALSLIDRHNSFFHGNKEYVREDTHINGIEGFWSYAKTWLYILSRRT